MLQEHFIMRLMLLIAVGIVYVKAYMNMAKRNSKETEAQRHIILKILGAFWAIIAVVMGCLGVYMITQITFPQEAIGPYISTNMIIRTSDQIMYWGYATLEQSLCISMISGAFEFLSLSAYCFMFKSSGSKWLTKIGKIFFCILFYIFYASATDFHYFDFHEWIAPILFAIMAFFALKTKSKVISNPIVVDVTNPSMDNESIKVKEPIDFSSKVEVDSKYMPQNKRDMYGLNPLEEEKRDVRCLLQSIEKTDKAPSDTGIEQIVPPNVVETIIEKQKIEEQSAAKQISPKLTVKYCRHCGRKLDYQSDKYCKHCGKKLF